MKNEKCKMQNAKMQNAKNAKNAFEKVTQKCIGHKNAFEKVKFG